MMYVPYISTFIVNSDINLQYDDGYPEGSYEPYDPLVPPWSGETDKTFGDPIVPPTSGQIDPQYGDPLVPHPNE